MTKKDGAYHIETAIKEIELAKIYYENLFNDLSRVFKQRWDAIDRNMKIIEELHLENNENNYENTKFVADKIAALRYSIDELMYS